MKSTKKEVCKVLNPETGKLVVLTEGDFNQAYKTEIPTEKWCNFWERMDYKNRDFVAKHVLTNIATLPA